MKRITKRSIVLLLLLTFVLLAFPSTSANAADEIKESNKVRVGWYQSDHFQEGDADQDYKSGYSYEYLQDVSNYTGWEYEYVSGSWSELYDALLEGEIDVLAGLSYTEERAELINYPAYEMGSESYYIYKRAGNETISSIDLSTLNGKKVGTLRNNLMTDYFEDWMEESGLSCSEVMFDDFGIRDEAFANGDIDALIAVNNNVPSNSGFTPVTMVGESSYYLAVTKDRTDLLDELNKALESLEESNPYFIQSLQIKYFNQTAVNAALSTEESEWLENHSTIKVGCINDYMPYCSIDSDGEVHGIITDIIGDWKGQLGLSDQLNIEYKAYPQYSDLITALVSGEVDVAFPVHDSIWSAEKQGIVQTNELIETGVHLIYKGEYQDVTTTEIIAVSDHSAFQLNYVTVNYPDSEIYVVDSLEDCLNAVKSGKATCTFLDSGQAEPMLSKRKFRSLNHFTLGDEIGYCMGVKKGNNVLYSILSRGISLTDKSVLNNAMYEYIDSTREYSIIDFVLDHTLLVISVILIITGLTVAVWRVHHQANIDILTGLGNKRAYQAAVKQLSDKSKDNANDYVVAVFDLNGLKNINDNYGHECGDMALVDVGKCLKKVFGNDCLYRFGGDEFIALEANCTLEEMKQKFNLLDWELNEINQKEHPYVVPLSVSKGAAAYISDTDTCFEDVFNRADQMMYEDKRAYYEKHGDRRR
ncbi:MAG: GGDEF domain-containing protein [Lachnospiraceae bacterium]|nr:GGDEF domain-containing protein [Lachnospiraceae bacterium]